MQPETLVDLDRYPLLDADGRAEIVARARADLQEAGSAVLPGFLTSRAIEAMTAEATAQLPHGHRRDRMLGAYSQAVEPWMAEDHPVRYVSPYRMAAIATDQLAPGGPTLSVYEWDAMTSLIAEILGLPELHRVADPLMRCNFSILTEGDEHGWHFDRNDFVVSLLVQKPEEGGVFEFAPGIRSAEAENFDDVREVMAGRSDRVRRLAVEPGTLALFQGRNAIHRVTRVSGARPRIIALFSYHHQPGLMFGEEAQERVFGRSVPADGTPAAPH